MLAAPLPCAESLPPAEVLAAWVTVRLANSEEGENSPEAPDALPVPDEPEPELPDPDDPAPAPEAPPVDPSTASTELIRCAPGRNTICPSEIVPVSVWPIEFCQASTAFVVPVCQLSLIVISSPESKPIAFRSRLSSRMSGPLLSLDVRSRKAGVVPLKSTTGSLSTSYSA